ncbi:MAG: agmatine deiminase family protein [Chitinispirillaceae bacterium]|nr:agmatine deiminase family protein [Chitinispirillaceae bacterium]
MLFGNLLTASLFMVTIDSVTVPPPAPVRSIAEFEPMEGVLVTWPLGVPDSLVREVAKDAIVYCITNNEPVVTAALTASGVNMRNVTIISATPDPGGYYTRDFGPLWVADGSGKINAIDCAYPANGRWNSDEFPVIAGEQLGVTVYQFPLFFTGGNFMTDGHGGAVSTDLVWKDNFELTPDTIDSRMGRYFGVTSYHVIKHPFSLSWEPVEHVDCFAKFLAPDKVAIAKLPQPHSDYASLEKVAVYFGSLTSAYGKPYRIYRIFSAGTGSEAYLNATIVNRKILVPVAGTVNDSAALWVYRNAMPGYRVIPFSFDSTQGEAWSAGDALHCRTMGVPDRGMLCIRHLPLADTVVDPGTGYQVQAMITAYSGQPLIPDSLQVYYKANGQEPFSATPLRHISGDTFRAVIPSVSDTSTFMYYIHAADLSGRKEALPCAGASDPFSFVGYPASGKVRFGMSGRTGAFGITISHCPGTGYVKIGFSVKNRFDHIKISIYSYNGRLIRVWSGNRCQGSILWNGRSPDGNKAAFGLYVLHIRSGPEACARAFLLR